MLKSETAGIYNIANNLGFAVLVNFNDRKFTIIALMFLFLCIYNAGVFNNNQVAATNNNNATDKKYTEQAKYKITVDPYKPENQKTYIEKAIGLILDYQGTPLPKIVSNIGDEFHIIYSETLGEVILVDDTEIKLKLGDKKVPEYVEGALFLMEKGQSKTFSTRDESMGIEKIINIKVIDKISQEKNSVKNP